MKLSRRYFGLLLPFLARSEATAEASPLPSSTFRFEDLPVRKNGSMVLRQILKGTTHTGYLVDLHESDLAPGQMPHAPHHHVHEEILLIREGQIEITVNGKTSQLDPGSVAYLASGDHHGWKNSGTVTARYFVLALGDDKS
jgi:quercetin dioxygenase-like cupin family protein